MSKFTLFKALLTAGILTSSSLLANNALASSVHLPMNNPPALKTQLATQALLLDIKNLNQGLIAVGEQGIIIYKTSSNEDWQQADVPVSSLLTSVTFVDDQLGFAVGHQGVILRSQDAGKSWQLVNADEELPPLLTLGFVDKQLGFALGAYGTLLKTSDGGASWQDISDQLPNEEGMHLNSLLVDKQQTLYLAGEEASLFISTDLGANWTYNDLSDQFNSIFHLSLGADKEIYLTGLRGSLGVSYDQGISWQALRVGTSQSLNFSLPLAQQGLLAIGQNGIYLTGKLTNHGELEQLKQKQLASRASLVALAELEGKFYAVGKGGIHLLDTNPEEGDNDQ